MKLVDLLGMEGTIGKLGRIMPTIKLHAAGRYHEDTLAAGPEAQQRELEQRRAGVTTREPCRVTHVGIIHRKVPG